MLRIGLTGGIGSGKSMVATMFQGLGIPLVDADQAARAVVRPGTEGLRGIVELFGAGILTPDGELDRPTLRTRIFADPAVRQRVNALLHPLIREWMADRLRELDAVYAILSIPLLVENGLGRTVDRVLVVDVTEGLQIERICRRDHCTPTQAQAIIDAQCGRSERLAAADDIIDNSGDPARLKMQVTALHLRYLELARRHGAGEPGSDRAH